MGASATATVLIVVTLCFGVCACLIPLAGRLSLRVGAVDRPGGHKAHAEAMPCLGGIAVLGGLGLPLLLLALSSAPGLGALGPGGMRAEVGLMAVAVGALLVVGIVDDIRAIGATAKLSIEALVAVAVAGVALDVGAVEFLGLALGDPWGLVGLLAASFWIVSIINAYNMVDGMDGLAAGVGVLAAAGFAIVAVLSGQETTAIVAGGLAGSLAAFFVFNVPPARVFLGDAGSLPVGFLLAVLGVSTLTSGDGTWEIAPAILIVGIPATDITIAVARRVLRSVELVRRQRIRESFRIHMRAGPGLFSPDRGHLHHRVLDLGYAPMRALSIVLLSAGALAGAGVFSIVLSSGQRALFFTGVVCVAAVALARLYPELCLLRRGLLLPLFDSWPVRSRMVHGFYDIVVAGSTFVATWWLLNTSGIRAPAPEPLTFVVLGIPFLLLMHLGGVYRAEFRHAGMWQILRTGAVAALAGTVGLLGASLHVGGDPMLGPAGTVVFVYLLVSGVVAPRISFRLIDGWYQRASRGGRRTLIYGAGRGGHLVLRELHSNPELGLEPVAFLDDDPRLWGREVEGYPVLNPRSGIGEALEESEVSDVSDVIVSTRKIPRRRLERVLEECQENGESVRLLSFRWLGEGGEDGANIVGQERALAGMVGGSAR